ncbi:MAG: phytanoyl-CoA dioxygenase family protein [Byssovorax sp.]
MSSRRQSALEEYEERGFVVVRGGLDPEDDLRPVIDEYGALADRLAARWLEDGTISRYDATEKPALRLLQLMRETSGRCFQHLDISLPTEDDIRHDTPAHHGPAVFDLLRSPRLLDVVEWFVGPEIYSNPCQHMRLKTPESERSARSQACECLTAATHWHQDRHVLNREADDSNVVSVWLPLTEATVENGCLLVVPRSHQQGLVFHCNEAQSIPEPLVGEDRVPVPMEPGDVLILHPLTKHASLPNVSDGPRWSFDLRYNVAGRPTGRPWFPGFVARSKSNPASELSDPEAWERLWRGAREELAGKARPKFERD